jgi:hypothetical protein
MQYQTSKDAVCDELKLFSTPNTESSVNRIEYKRYHPTSALSQTGPISFHISPQENQYVDLSRSRLVVYFNMENNTGGQPTTAGDASCANNMFHTLWSQIDVYLNEVLISPCNNLYHYKAYIDTVLEENYFNNNVSATQLYYHDTAGAMDASTYGTNDGYDYRNIIVSDGGDFRLTGPLRADLWSTNKWILPGVDIKMTLRQTPQALRIIKGAGVQEFKIVLKQIYFTPCMVTVKQSITDAHLSILNSGQNAKYPYTRHQIEAYNVPAGSHFFRKDQIFNNEKPDRVVAVLVNAQAFKGSTLLNPFNFQFYDVRQMDFTFDDESLNGRRIDLDENTGEYKESFYALTAYMGNDGDGNNGPNIKIDEFSGGYALYIFDQYGGLKKQHFDTKIQKGYSKLTMDFNTALPEDVALIVYGTFNDIFEIDKEKNIILPRAQI